jgi:hypothetical protein
MLYFKYYILYVIFYILYYIILLFSIFRIFPRSLSLSRIVIFSDFINKSASYFLVKIYNIYILFCYIFSLIK